MANENHNERKRSKALWRKKDSQLQVIEPHRLVILGDTSQILLSLNSEVVTRYRQLYNRLDRGHGMPKRFGLTSALRGEGVTTVALGLGAVLAADLEGKICVIELNLWWPELSERAGVTGRPGLVQVAAGAALDDALLCTSLNNLCLLPAGDLNGEEPTRLAHSQTLRNLLIELNERFDHLILDIPAVLATGDSLALSALADQIGLVVRAGVTPTSVVQRAMDDIQHLPVTCVVLNGEKIAVPDWLYRLIPED